MVSFELSYNLLSVSKPELGKVAIMPWDSEIFKFKVAQYELGDIDCIILNKDHCKMALKEWSSENMIKLIGCNINSNPVQSVTLLQELNFYFVDSILNIRLNNFNKIEIPKPRFKVRLIQNKDNCKVKKIAETSFKHGKYFADSRFPKNLAELRNKQWIKNAIESDSKKNKIYILENKGDIIGFFHVLCDNSTGDLRLAAIEPEYRHGILGYHLFLSVFHELRENGIKKLKGKISSSNLSVLNIYLSFGFICNSHELMFHKYL